MGYFSGKQTIGILGGGQLGKMLLYTTQQWDIQTKVMDPSNEAPARIACNHFIQGDLMDYDKVLQFGKDVDIVTIEIENVNTDALMELEKKGYKSIHKQRSLKPSKTNAIKNNFTKKIKFPQHHFNFLNPKKHLKMPLQEDEFLFLLFGSQNLWDTMVME